MIFTRLMHIKRPWIRLFSTQYDSCYEMVIDRLSIKDKNQSFSKKKSWTWLINDLIEAQLPSYSEKLQRSVQRTLNYRHDIHRGNQRSFEFVNSVKKRFESSLTEDNIDVFLLRAIRDLGDPELAIQYLNYIENSSSKNITLSHRLLVLETAGRAEDKIKKVKVERTILSIAQDTLNIVESLDIKDHNISYIIGAYSNTRKWRENALPLYLSKNISPHKEDVEERVTRSAVMAGERLAIRTLKEEGPTKDFWSIISAKNFITNNFQLRYVQVEEVQKSHDRVYKEYINCVKNQDDLEPLFQFFRKHWSIISWDVARALKDKLEKLDKNVIIKMEDMSNRGICKSCAVRLKRDKFDPSEIEKLRNAIFEKCLKKGDIYLSSLPGEVERFENFCAKLNKYDVVIDGLNVALTHLPKFEDGSLTKSKVGRKMLLTQSKNILGILTTLHNRGMKNIVIIHRDGIQRFPDYREISKLCHIYTAKRDSQDDPFMMLAALSSGFGTLFVSNDRLRQHNYLLEDSNLQSLFTRWQLTHQCHHKVWVTPDRAQGRMKYRYVVTDPHSFELRTQKEGPSWHLPLLQRYEEDKGHLSVPSQWLCLNFNKT
ncbi:uncharacterized protein mldr [Lepeophtheirus salmonis]|uniref:uncharacterized protein mldr n=1 Tax=Lepeophtheirus salmonis TaxID=72036 RepID=UPI001AE47E5E|nr:uncharacterized protein LOC121117219 [Lepeophtheirus salmonis]